MFHTSVLHKIDIINVNNEVDKVKKEHIARYNKQLSEYIDDVTRLALYEITDSEEFKEGRTESTSSIKTDLGEMLLNPPRLEDLSLPSFFETNNVEVINLPKGYLYITLDKDNDTYHLVYHENTASLSPYLDMGRTISNTVPALLREGTVVSTGAWSISRLYDLVKLLPFVK